MLLHAQLLLLRLNELLKSVLNQLLKSFIIDRFTINPMINRKSHIYILKALPMNNAFEINTNLRAIRKVSFETYPSVLSKYFLERFCLQIKSKA